MMSFAEDLSFTKLQVTYLITNKLFLFYFLSSFPQAWTFPTKLEQIEMWIDCKCSGVRQEMHINIPFKMLLIEGGKEKVSWERCGFFSL